MNQIKQLRLAWSTIHSGMAMDLFSREQSASTGEKEELQRKSEALEKTNQDVTDWLDSFKVIGK